MASKASVNAWAVLVDASLSTTGTLPWSVCNEFCDELAVDCSIADRRVIIASNVRLIELLPLRERDLPETKECSLLPRDIRSRFSEHSLRGRGKRSALRRDTRSRRFRTRLLRRDLLRDRLSLKGEPTALLRERDNLSLSDSLRDLWRRRFARDGLLRVCSFLIDLPRDCLSTWLGVLPDRLRERERHDRERGMTISN